MRCLDAENNVLLVQHLVMFKTVKECGGGAFWIAGEEHGRPRHPLRRLLFQNAHEIFERRFEPPGLGEKHPAAATPRIHDQHHQSAERHWDPAPSTTLSMFAERNVTSTMRNGTISAPAAIGNQPHIRQNT